MKISVKYTLSADDAAGVLTLDYSATTDKKTILNPTNHTYFNLAGPVSCLVSGRNDGLQNLFVAKWITVGGCRRAVPAPLPQVSGTVDGHEIESPIEAYTPVDDQSIPTGEVASVAVGLLSAKGGKGHPACSA